MLDPREVLHTIDRLQSTFEELTVRGLRSCGNEQLTTLSNLHEELDRIGAAHLAGRLEVLIAAIRSDDRSSPAGLMRAQASLRCFDRILTLESVNAQLSAVLDDSDGCEGDNGHAAGHAHNQLGEEADEEIDDDEEDE